MSFLTKLLAVFTRSRADDLLLRGHDAFSAKDYKLAYKHFIKASKAFYDNKRMIISSLTNAAIAAENMNDLKEAAKLYYRVSKLKAEEKQSFQEIKDTLEKTSYFMRKINSSKLHQVLAVQLLFAIASQDLPQANKIVKKATKLKEDIPDKYFDFIIEYWRVFNTNVTVGESALPQVKIPQEFQFISLMAEEITDAHSSVEISLDFIPSKPEKVKTGTPVSIQAKIESAGPMKINSISLSPGSKGIIVRSPENITEDHIIGTVDFDFTVEPQLTGKWMIGPVLLDYQLGKYSFQQQSNTLELEVAQAEAILKLDTKIIVIDEDFEYELVVNAKNEGKGILENIRFELKIPMGVKITSGTNKKTIGFLQPSESFEFTTRLAFDISAFTTGHEIKITAQYGNKKQETSVIIGGSN
ncbi:MAG: hypothetical protein ACTSP4_08405 [Candidatus Hodarchaeales archaeon]